MQLADKPISIPPPANLAEARRSPWWTGYLAAIEEEISNLEKLRCWDYVPLKEIPKGTNILRSKLVFDDKRGPDGKLQKFKARMVACGYSQVHGIDYTDTYASVVVTKSFRILLAVYNLNASFSMKHWDVKQAFINAPLQETIYVRPIQGFQQPGKENCVLRLRKALYGTKQAANAWQRFLRKILTGLGGKQHPKDECVHVYREGEAWTYVCTHVDDIFTLCNDKGRNIRTKIYNAIGKEVIIEDKGEIGWALSTRIERDADKGILKISQKADIEALVRDLGMEDAREEHIPASGGRGIHDGRR